jgi:hypothetical protein
MNRFFYSDTIADFLARSNEDLLGRIVEGGQFNIETTQRDAWQVQLDVLRLALAGHRSSGKVYFEYSVPRLGKRIDVIVLLAHVIFVIEFKVGEAGFPAAAIDQVYDYSLDLKHFHESSHHQIVAPILVSTAARSVPIEVETTGHGDGLLLPIRCAAADLGRTLAEVLNFTCGENRPPLIPEEWEAGRYSPTPTIVEAALALWGGHGVAEISRTDAGATNLTRTSESICQIIRSAQEEQRKSICFITGVPGAGKTLVGLDIATRHFKKADELYSVFLSGNGPLVAILREALARDKVRREREKGETTKLGRARSEVKAFIQNVHHFRDECLVDPGPPIEHVALFDEAQRAWDLKQTADFMHRKKKRPDFKQSEPEFLISCMDRHPDWAVVVCLVGGGQEINTGEAGIGEWVRAIQRSFSGWHIHISPQLHDSEYGAEEVLGAINRLPNVHHDQGLHLGISMRSFRAERVSAFVKALLDYEAKEARRLHDEFSSRYPIMLTRNLATAKEWLRQQARGSERYGVVVSSQAQRLKPHAIDVRSPMNPVHWFLATKEDVRSSYYLEDVATEFHIQGLELDWAAVVWDGDFRWSDSGWKHFAFKGKKWQRIKQDARQSYLKNAYRVLLTRARQGMVIVVPEGDNKDPTRSAEYYDPSYQYLESLGLPVLS